MLSLSDYINKNNNLFLNTFGSIRFELDESSMNFLSDDTKTFINEGYYIMYLIKNVYFNILLLILFLL